MNWLSHLIDKPTRRIIGFMSGTSTDGIDTVVVEVSGARRETKVKILAFRTYPYDPEIRRRIFAIYPPHRLSGRVVTRLSFDLGEAFARAALDILTESGLKPADVDLISHHGVFIYHEPADRARGRPGAHLEIGEPAVIAERTGIPVVADLRVRDVAAGGNGSPLSPYVDWILFADSIKGRAVQNIGGIANVTGLPPNARIEEIQSFDTGPGNMLVDGLVARFTHGRETFDRDGERAARGRVDPALLDHLVQTPFIQMAPPKAAGRENFGETFLQRLLRRADALRLGEDDVLATATAFTVEAIASSYEQFFAPRFTIDEAILGGGGVHNRTMMRMLKERLPRINWLRHEDFGIDGDAREAITWAVLANESIQGLCNNVPSATGARHPVILGKFIPGSY
jgi:anhydro-N-acetylmuramic acid kinase